MLKKLFHIFNSLLIILYLFPGSIIGYFLYRDFSQQPQLTSDFLSLSSNHVYTFIVFTILGVLAFKDLKKIGVYLIITSIFFFKSAILSLTIRLSVSISVSPGPRIPIPPF